MTGSAKPTAEVVDDGGYEQAQRALLAAFQNLKRSQDIYSVLTAVVQGKGPLTVQLPTGQQGSKGEPLYVEEDLTAVARHYSTDEDMRQRILRQMLGPVINFQIEKHVRCLTQIVRAAEQMLGTLESSKTNPN